MLPRRLTAAVACVFSLLLSPAAQANDAIADRLESLLGQERAAVRGIPADRIGAITSDPAATIQRVSASGGVVYDRDWLAAQPPAQGGPEWRCLAEALYFEARGESVRGIFAVGEVILNRVDSAAYPDTVCDVVNEGTGRLYACQFTYTCDGRAETITEPRAWTRVGKVARLLLSGAPRELTEGATHYHTKAVNPSWARRFPRTATVGFHHFYRQPVRTAQN